MAPVLYIGRQGEHLPLPSFWKASIKKKKIQEKRHASGPLEPGGGDSYYNFVYTYVRLKRVVLQRLIFPSQAPINTWNVPRHQGCNDSSRYYWTAALAVTMHRTVGGSTDSVTVVAMSWRHSSKSNLWPAAMSEVSVLMSSLQIAIEHQKQHPIVCQKRCETEWQLTCHTVFQKCEMLIAIS